jgi:hypothetical protein
MARKKKFIGNQGSKAQVWYSSPPVTKDDNLFSVSIGGKTLSYPSNGTVADAVSGMQQLWQSSQWPEFNEIQVSIPSTTNPGPNPQGGGTNEIQTVYISSLVTGGSFQLAWLGARTAFLADPKTAPSLAQGSITTGLLNGKYIYTTTLLNQNPLGQTGESRAGKEASITISHQAALVVVPTGPVGTIGRRIYRSPAGGVPGSEQLVATVWGNAATTFEDNVSDNQLGVGVPTSNTTGIPYSASALQLAGILQELLTIGPGNVVVTGGGTANDPWVIQFVAELGAAQQDQLVWVDAAFSFPAHASKPGVVITEIQQGVAPFAMPPTDGSALVLTGPPGVPFYVATATGSSSSSQSAHNKGNLKIALLKDPSPNVTIDELSSVIPTISIAPIAPTVTADRIVQGAPAINEVQRITIGPNAQSGPGVTSTITLSWNGQTTGAIPFPPQPCVAAINATAGNLNSANGYVWVVAFVTQYGETEPSQPTSIIKITNQQASLASIPTGASVVTARKLYRAKLDANGNIGSYQYLHTLADNTTTTYTDNTADASLGVENPPATNYALQGALEALSNTGQGTITVSIANYPAWSGHYAGQPIVYDVEFEGALGGNSQPLVTGDVSSVAILPRIMVTEVRRGAPP